MDHLDDDIQILKKPHTIRRTLKKIDYFKSSAELLVSRRSRLGGSKKEQHNKLGSSWGGCLTIIAFVLIVTQLLSIGYKVLNGSHDRIITSHHQHSSDI